MIEENRKKKKGWLSFLNDSVQLRFYRKENFEQIGSMELSPRSIYIVFSSFILIIFIVVFCLLAFTPLQRLIPRLSSLEHTKKFIELNAVLDDIETSLESQELYLATFRKLLIGNDNIDLSNFEVSPNSELEVSQSIEKKAASEEIEIESGNNWIAPRNTSILGNVNGGKNIGSIFEDIESVNFVAPLNGIISADFEPQKNHLAVDIVAPKNTPVQAIDDGYIIIADWSLETGHSIGIQHENNILSFYKHNSVLLKEKGNFVKSGEIVAIIGNSGKLTSGPHLHFELWHKGKPVNPNDYINLK